MLFDGIETIESEEISVENTGDITFSNGKLVANKTAFEVTESTVISIQMMLLHYFKGC